MSTAVPDPSWVIGKHAFLRLKVLRRNHRTEIDPMCRRVPYQWQGVHYQDHDDQPFLLLHNSAGGFVEGDAAELHVWAEPETRFLITTTAATKFYRCESGQTSVDAVDVTLGEGALLEYLPDEVIPYAQSRVARATRIDLRSSSRLFASDLISAGRINFREGEAFAFAALRSEVQVRIDGKLAVLDRLQVKQAEEVAALKRLWNGRRHLGTVCAYAPDLPMAVEDKVHELLGELEGTEAGVTRLGNLVVVRLLATDVWQAHGGIYAVWQALRPAIAGKPARPIV